MGKNARTFDKTHDARRGNLTFVKGIRNPNELDPVSAAILDVGSTGTSIFDPVLCELAYRWLCPPGGQVLDPFAGGSVRGIVASRLGRKYFGVDLSERQIKANEQQAKAVCKKNIRPRWVVGDSADLGKIAKGIHADFVFSCPPYADLEVYSDDPRDISTMAYGEFRKVYCSIIEQAVALLKPDRFACFVVGDARDSAGFYYGLPWHTVDAFERAGARLYNEAVLVTAVGSLPVRARKQFEASRKLGKTHQNVLVFCKGDPVKATSAVGKVQFGEGNDLAEILSHSDSGATASTSGSDLNKFGREL